MNKKRIFMAGVGGMLGEAFYKTFEKQYDIKCTDIDLNEEWLSFCDFRDFNDYKAQVFDYKPDYLFHIGALTDLEYCEVHSDEAYLTNTISVENAVFIANELDIPILYISTAGIFDGSKDCFDDWDVPNPICAYARSKYQGELFVKENAVKYFIFRAGWMMGGGPQKDKKFILKILEQIRGGARDLKIVNDKFGTPTYTHDFANNAKMVIERGYFGLYNMVCSGLTSRLEVAEEMIKHLNLEDVVRVEIVDSAYFKNIYFAHRPSSERLINKKLELRNCNIMRDWRVCLAEYLDSYYGEYLQRKC